LGQAEKKGQIHYSSSSLLCYNDDATIFVKNTSASMSEKLIKVARFFGGFLNFITPKKLLAALDEIEHYSGTPEYFFNSVNFRHNYSTSTVSNRMCSVVPEEFCGQIKSIVILI